MAQMPMLSHLFHLAPPEIWALTTEEFTTYLEAAPAIAKGLTA